MNTENTIAFVIDKRLGVISTAPTGWTKEVNIIRWNGGTPKYDIREWDPSHERMSRGITLKPEEMNQLIDLVEAGREEVSCG